MSLYFWLCDSVMKSVYWPNDNVVGPAVAGTHFMVYESFGTTPNFQLNLCLKRSLELHKLATITLNIPQKIIFSKPIDTKTLQKKSELTDE